MELKDIKKFKDKHCTRFILAQIDCLSDEYKKELAEAKKGLYQEYILDDIKKILDKLECFYNNRELYIKNTTFDVATWDAKTFTNPHELKDFFVKSEFIGGTLEDIQILGQQLLIII